MRAAILILPLQLAPFFSFFTFLCFVYMYVSHPILPTSFNNQKEKFEKTCKYTNPKMKEKNVKKSK